MNSILSDNKNSIIYVLLISLVFSIALLVISFNKQTIAPVWFVKDYTPWSIEKTQEFRADHIYGYRHKGHDQVMQFFLNRSDSLRQLDLGRSQSFSDKMMLGGQLSSRFQFSYGLHGPISNILNKFNKKNYLETVFISINLSTLFWTILSFFVIFYLCQNIFGNSQYNYLYIFLFNPLFIVNAEEAWQMLILGTYFVILGSLQIAKSKKTYSYFLNFIFLFIGSLLIIRGNSLHYWVYFPLTFLFFFPYLYSKYNLSKLIIIITALALGAMISVSIILDGFIAIQNSSSNINAHPLSNLQKMEYPAIPITYFVGMPLLHNLYDFLNIKFPFNGIIPAGEGFFGPSLLILSCIGFFYFKNNYLRLAVLLLLLYWCGPLQLIFRLIFGGPFISETSVGGRLGVYVYIILLSLSIYAVQSHLNKIKIFRNYIYIYCFFVITIQLTQFYLILNSVELDIKKVWAFGLIGPISSLILILSLQFNDNFSKFMMIMSLLIIPLYSTLSPYGINSVYPSAINYENLNLENKINFKLSHNDVGALAVQYRNEGYTKTPLASNLWYFTKIRSINGFYTPVDRDYLYLYYYQYFSNWPSSIESKNSIKLPGRAVDEKPTLEKLSKSIHRHHAMSIPVYENKFSSATERFFNLTGVNLIATEDQLLLDDQNYALLQKINGINLWKRVSSFSPIRIVCNITIEKSKLDAFEILLFDSQFDLNNTIIAYKENEFYACKKNTQVIDFDFSQNNQLTINLNNPSGIVVTNITYNDNIEVYDSYKKLTIFRCNSAFLCIVPSEESTQIILNYKKSSINEKINRLLVH